MSQLVTAPGRGPGSKEMTGSIPVLRIYFSKRLTRDYGVVVTSVTSNHWPRVRFPVVPYYPHGETVITSSRHDEVSSSILDEDII